MTDIVIQAENLGQALHHRPPGRQWTLRSPARRAARQAHLSQGNNLEEVWALKDVRCEIRREEFEPNYGIIETRTGFEILGSNRGVQ